MPLDATVLGKLPDGLYEADFELSVLVLYGLTPRPVVKVELVSRLHGYLIQVVRQQVCHLSFV